MKTAGLSANVSNVSGVDFRRVEGQGERGGDVSREQTRAPENWGLASASLGGEGRSAAPCPELRQLTYHRGGGRLDPQFTVTAELAKGWLRANSDVSLAALLSCQPFRGQVTENRLLSGFSFVKEPPGECRAQPACSLSQWNRAVRSLPRARHTRSGLSDRAFSSQAHTQSHRNLHTAALKTYQTGDPSFPGNLGNAKHPHSLTTKKFLQKSNVNIVK